jgi:2-(1,2-epoxy-1,2-dihydrophenyl)acetyl-CoA isomerase
LDDVLVDITGHTMTVTLNRPHRRNAVTPEMWSVLAGFFTRARSDPDVRVVVLTGSGDAFCSGADLVVANQDQHDDRRPPRLHTLRQVADAVLALHRLPKPTVARVRGVAVGGGWSLALACDLVVASENASFSQIFAKRGLSLDAGASWLLPRLVGVQKAKELAFLARRLSATEACDLGLVNVVVPDDQLDATVADWTATLEAGPPIALSMTKALLDQSHLLGLDQALEAEAHAQALNFTTIDTTEALAAFVEKRQPTFVGR